jgi:YD repeat-containing protein
MNTTFNPLAARLQFSPRYSAGLTGLALILAPLLPLTILATYPNNVNDADDEYALKFGVDSATGVSSWHVSEPYINLWIYNQPLTYFTSYGEPVSFALAFRQRSSDNANCAGFGPSWSHSWHSSVYFNGSLGPTYMPLGGQRRYVADGVTMEIKSASTMISTNFGWEIRLPNGGKLEYNQYYGGYRTYLGQEIDPNGRSTSYSYDSLNGYVRLRSRTDPDGRAVTINYDAINVWQIQEVIDPYNRRATFTYDTTDPTKLI